MKKIIIGFSLLLSMNGFADSCNPPDCQWLCRENTREGTMECDCYCTGSGGYPFMSGSPLFTRTIKIMTDETLKESTSVESEY